MQPESRLFFQKLLGQLSKISFYISIVFDQFFKFRVTFLAYDFLIITVTHMLSICVFLKAEIWSQFAF